jgi:putative hydrolase of the HAD superfamily
MTDAERPIRLVTFDLYDTLIELKPPRWERLAGVCRRLGIETDATTLRAADRIAEDYYTAENALRPIRDRPREERDAFRTEHMARWLEAAGLPHDRATAKRVRGEYISEFEERPDHRHYQVFPDVMPALRRLRAAGIKTAVISNADADVTELCRHLAFAAEMDLIVTSALVGWEKPDPRTFRAALDPLGVAAADALHVGDQPRSDVAGALGVGMRAALLDRYGHHRDAPVTIVRGLGEVGTRVLSAEC